MHELRLTAFVGLFWSKNKNTRITAGNFLENFLLTLKKYLHMVVEPLSKKQEQFYQKQVNWKENKAWNLFNYKNKYPKPISMKSPWYF